MTTPKFLLDEFILEMQRINKETSAMGSHYDRHERSIIEFADEEILSSKFRVCEQDDGPANEYMTVGSVWANTRHIPVDGTRLYISVDYLMPEWTGEKQHKKFLNWISDNEHFRTALSNIRTIPRLNIPPRMIKMMDQTAYWMEHLNDDCIEVIVDGRHIVKANTQSIHISFSARPDRRAFMTFKFTERLFKEFFQPED